MGASAVDEANYLVEHGGRITADPPRAEASHLPAQLEQPVLTDEIAFEGIGRPVGVEPVDLDALSQRGPDEVRIGGPPRGR